MRGSGACRVRGRRLCGWEGRRRRDIRGRRRQGRIRVGDSNSSGRPRCSARRTQHSTSSIPRRTSSSTHSTNSIRRNTHHTSTSGTPPRLRLRSRARRRSGRPRAPRTRRPGTGSRRLRGCRALRTWSGGVRGWRRWFRRTQRKPRRAVFANAGPPGVTPPLRRSTVLPFRRHRHALICIDY
ncbi:hypothetical protein C8J57DRAFT_382818 [Mycena rebaudengoi]|nr:hypothetical protein C8J57DRAFT_382818 [Mycena rebaudengoi]